MYFCRNGNSITHSYYFNSIMIVSILLRQILRKPLFAGDSEIDQLFRIFRIMGTPTEKTWPGVTQLPDFRASFPNWDPQMLPIPNAIMNNPETELPDLFMVIYGDSPAAFLQLILFHFSTEIFQKLMVLNPHSRISAKNAMQHDYFNDVEFVKCVQLPLDTP